MSLAKQKTYHSERYHLASQISWVDVPDIFDFGNGCPISAVNVVNTRKKLLLCGRPGVYVWELLM